MTFKQPCTLLLPICHLLPIPETENKMQRKSLQAFANLQKAYSYADFRIDSKYSGAATTRALLCDSAAVTGCALAFTRTLDSGISWSILGVARL
jgi:hypothetical protein